MHCSKLFAPGPSPATVEHRTSWSGRATSLLLARPTCSAGLLIALTWLSGCTTHHWAEVANSSLPPPSGQAVRHSSRVIVALSAETQEPQCVVGERLHPVCFYNLRPALERGLVRSLWPSFPEVMVGQFADARPGDYVLQVDVMLDALPPDPSGPGWSAGARGRFRLMRDGKVLLEETTASRSRPHFAYGSPLGDGATEVIDATIEHIASALFTVQEQRPFQAAPLPQVAALEVGQPARARRAPSASPELTAARPSSDEPPHPALAKTSTLP